MKWFIIQAYEQAGNIIYGSKLPKSSSKTGGLLDALCFMYLSSQAGVAGHNCLWPALQELFAFFRKKVRPRRALH